MIRLLPVVLAALALLLPGRASAEERIIRFFSDIAVERNGTLEVVETIRVRAEGDQIKRGIYRDLPTRYLDRNGRTIRVDFDVLSVKRDGDAEPYALESIGNGTRVRIGQADVLLQPAEHLYELRYRTTRQIGFFADYDELYWNVTGNDWSFPIELAEAQIRLPERVRFGQRAAYTGVQGSTGSNALVASEAPGEILFRTTAPLAAGEGLTIAAAWPKNVVQAPAPRSAMALWLQDNVPPAVGHFGLLGIIFYYFYAWKKVGRGPAPGPVVPLFSPPEGLSPAGMRYVSGTGNCDNRTFAAALIDLAVRGKLRLVEGDKGWFSDPKTTVEKKGGTDGLPAPEAAMFAALFEGRDRVLMDDANHKIFSAAENALQTGLAKAYEGKLFIHNRRWAAAGMLFLLAAIWATAASILVSDPDLPHRRTGLAFVSLTLASAVGAAVSYRLSRRATSGVRILGVVLAVLLGLAAMGLGMATVGSAVENLRILPLLIPLLSVPLILSAFWWMSAPTRTGRATMDRIAGFRQYLSIAEEERLQTMHPPEKTPELFERYLPYAVALDVENAWASRFTRVLAAAAAAGQTQTMGWYSGHSSPWTDPDDFVDRVGSSLSSNVSSASTAPGSSSGSGGGGSSGGGGGGGGGGGW